MPIVNELNAIRISLASPEQIRGWSHGEVIKAETINYRTLKPERDGLFCEKIFGPTKDFECSCGKYKKQRYQGVICDKCGVEVTHSRVRRERMAHIELAAPVAHIWFVKLVPSRLAVLLDLSPRNLERVIYFAQYIITAVDGEACQDKIGQLKEETSRRVAEQEDRRIELEEELEKKIDEMKSLQRLRLLSEENYRQLRDKYGDVFKAGIGAEAILELLKQIDIRQLYQDLLEEVCTTSGQRRKKASKRLRLVDDLRRSGNKPEWMVLTVLPVLPPALRPAVQLDGGRFAISDLNNLYRRVINRNKRLRRLIQMGAPQVIIHNEENMLQEAVDSLIDNGRRGRAVTTGNAHTLKSLSDMLKGKQGRFRQNLLGKRVDYSGRAVIVVGPELKLNQCGLPQKVALELFKPFVVHKLMERGYASNIKSARRQMERPRQEVWDLLNEVVKESPVLLNRAPTLHRLSLQAFDPVIIDGDAFQIHPLVCTPFNADFDGDQMAVHVPLSKAAVREAKEHMLSIHNMLLPSSGDPIVTPSLEMVLGCYYLTSPECGGRGEGKVFGNFEEAKLAYELGVVELRAEITVREEDKRGEKIKTTVGRIIFNDALPPQFRFLNDVIDKSTLRRLVSDCLSSLGNVATATFLDDLKQLGFDYATKSGTSIAIQDVEVPQCKPQIIREAEEQVKAVEEQFSHGLITDDERYTSQIQIWTETTDKIAEAISQSLHRYGGIYMMSTSGAKGNISQIRQMAGMRGLMTDPSGRIIDFPIKSSFREGLTPMEYFISTHGARKGLADTALRTSSSGYLTRRLVDVAQDVIVVEESCGTAEGIWVSGGAEGSSLPALYERLVGRLVAADVNDPRTGETIVYRNEEIDEAKASKIVEGAVTRVYVRSPLSCHSRYGVCQYCYGRDLALRRLITVGTAAGIIAAESIGEPGTQLTLRTFHTGGIVSTDITSGLPRVEELFEARIPKASAIVSEISGVAEVFDTDKGHTIRITSSEPYLDEYALSPAMELAVSSGEFVGIGAVLAYPKDYTAGKTQNKLPMVAEQQPIQARVSGQVITEDNRLYIQYEGKDEKEYSVPHATRLIVKPGDKVNAGDQLTEGVMDPHDILHIIGKEAVQRYLIDEVQKVYRSQGVSISDKHIEVIVRQMLSRVQILSSGDTELLPGELVNRFDYENINASAIAEGGEPATAQGVLLGITRASLSSQSWLASASFQETAHVLVDAAIKGSTDRLRGLKENVILGKLIPAQILKREIEEESLQPDQLELTVPYESELTVP
ncbi:MAG: DNA-directed RNA polymerase subunit beta' [Chloroflexi bacterium]|nr:DNA-directed RNA polymerase subunit beta' [Chloroflexota bacterium]